MATKPARHLPVSLLLLLCMALSLTSTTARRLDDPAVYTGKHPSQLMTHVLGESVAEQDPAEQILPGLAEPAAAAAAGEVPTDPLAAAATPSVEPAAGPTSTSVIPTNPMPTEADMQVVQAALVPATEPVLVPTADQPLVIFQVPEVTELTGALPEGVATVTAAVTPTGCKYKYTETDIRPLRTMWQSAGGYCGETTLQMILLARGVWLSQNQARSMPKCTTDLLLLTRATVLCNAYTFARDWLVVDTPGNSYWDYSNGTGKSQQFVGWMKQQVAAGRPVMAAVRLSGYTDQEYDHLEPYFGVCSNNMALAAPLNSTTDGFSLSTDLGDEIFRRVNTTGFYADRYKCMFGFAAGQGGCIPSGAIANYGLSIGQLNDAGKYLIKTTKLVITGWASGYRANEEPGEPGRTSGAGAATDTAKYQLSMWGLKAGANYTTFRLPNRFDTPKKAATPTQSDPATIPTTASLLAALCTQRTANATFPYGCKKVTYMAPAGGAVTFNETSALGMFQANSLQYFLTVLGKF